MSRLFLITKTMLKNSYNFAGAFSFGKNKAKREAQKTTPGKRIAIGALMAFIFASFFFSMFMTGWSIFSVAKQGMFMGAALTAIIPILIALIFVFTMTLVISIFFLSNDSNVYLPLPIKPEEIFFGRLLVASIDAFLIEIAFVLPFIVSYDVVVQPGLLVYLNELIFVFVIPFIPLSITFLIAIIIGRVFNIGRHKEAFTTVMMVFSIGTILAGEFGITAINSGIGTGETETDYILRTRDTFIALANKLHFADFIMQFPRNGLMDDSLIGTLNILAFAGISAALVVVASLAAKWFYLKTLVGGDEHAAHRKKGDVNKALKSESKNDKPYFSVLKAEWRGIVRSPTYVFNLLTPPILIVVIAAFSLYGGMSASQGSGEAFSFTTLIAAVAPYFNFNFGAIVFFIGAGTMFMAAMTMISSTAISREGKNAYLMKTWPVKPIIQLRAKITIGTSITAFLLFAATIIVGVIGHLNPVILALIYLPIVILLIIANYLMILVDLMHPFVEWDNETAAVKQNKNGLFGMLLCFAFAVVLFFIGLGSALIGLNIIWSFLIIIVISGGTLYLLERGIKKKGSAIFEGIQ
ncbi:MAG: hypothetical protein NTV44_02355 [Firmicutes bacterium]|nr:hypothetical protein [Bacillota bacterium]